MHKKRNVEPFKAQANLCNVASSVVCLVVVVAVAVAVVEEEEEIGGTVFSDRLEQYLQQKGSPILI